MLQKIFQKLDKINLDNAKLILAISGGADSMTMFHSVQKYFEKNNLDKNNIIIAHYNHKFREESDEEAKSLREIFKDFEFNYAENEIKRFDENFLRKQRYDFFINVWEKYTGNVYLCLGHNLDDRIETMFLNTLRGCDIHGFLNMGFEDSKVLGTNTLKILRPLIYISKDEIKKFCKKNKINFFEDWTNKDNSFSQRNIIRNEIIAKLKDMSNKDKYGNMKFYQSFQNIFEKIGIKQENGLNMEKIFLSKYREADFGYRLLSKIASIDELIMLLKSLGIYRNISQNVLKELFDFLSKENVKYKYFNGVYFMSSHGEKYIIKAKPNFWQKTVAKKIKISKIGKKKFGDFELDICNPEFMGLELKFPESLDRFKSKKISKVLINQKIPFFWRNFVPVIAEGNDIKMIFNPKKLEGYI